MTNLSTVKLEQVVVEIASGVAHSPPQIAAQIIARSERKQRNLKTHHHKHTVSSSVIAAKLAEGDVQVERTRVAGT